MRARLYSLLFASLGLGLFGAVAAANLLLDPEAVLGTGIFGWPLNANDRYLRMATFTADPDRYDGLLFAASRGNAIPLDVLSEKTGARFANFSVSVGQIGDHLAAFDYVLRTKAKRGSPVRSVLLVLDADIIGVPPIANTAIQSQWHPVLTGEPMARFKWRHVTAIQTKAWWNEIRRVAFPPGAKTRAGDDAWRRLASLDASTKTDALPAQVEAGSDGAQARRQPAPNAPRVTDRKHFASDIAGLEAFVAMCRGNGVPLTVALSPLNQANAQNFAAGDLDAVAAHVAEIVPVWDFGAPLWLSNRPDLWIDVSHYNVTVGRMMLDRMYGPTAGSARHEQAPPDFGALRQRPGR